MNDQEREAQRAANYDAAIARVTAQANWFNGYLNRQAMRIIGEFENGKR